MSKRKIMVVSGNLTPDIINVWTNSATVDPVFAATDEEGIELAAQQVFDAVVVDATDAAINTRKLYAVLPVLQPDVALVRYKGEEGRQLESRLKAVFNQQRLARIRRFMILDSSTAMPKNSWPAFSAN